VVRTPARVEEARFYGGRYVSLGKLAQLSGRNEADLLAWQRAGLFPAPTFRELDGSAWYPLGYVALLRRAANRRSDLRAMFQAELRRRIHQLRQRDRPLYASMMGSQPEGPRREERLIEASWWEFVSGGLGPYPRSPWVPALLGKYRSVQRVEALVARARPDDRRWRGQLRRALRSLEWLEAPLAHWNQSRSGRAIGENTPLARARRLLEGDAPPTLVRPPAPRGRTSLRGPRTSG
jgi:hypothetical protein